MNYKNVDKSVDNFLYILSTIPTTNYNIYYFNIIYLVVQKIYEQSYKTFSQRI